MSYLFLLGIKLSFGKLRVHVSYGSGVIPPQLELLGEICISKVEIKLKALTDQSDIAAEAFLKFVVRESCFSWLVPKKHKYFDLCPEVKKCSEIFRQRRKCSSNKDYAVRRSSLNEFFLLHFDHNHH